MTDEGEPAGPEPAGPDERGGRGEGDASAGAGRSGGAERRPGAGDLDVAADSSSHPAGYSAGVVSRLPTPARAAIAILGPILLTTAYFTVPFSTIGPKHSVLPWLVLAGLLTVLAIGMVVTTNRTLTDQTGKYPHPGVGILLLSWAAILVFAASYWAMATRSGQFVGLHTRLDALYFTGVTMGTVGYGDIHPSGQVGRAVVLGQLVYTFAFLVSGVTALRTRAQAKRAQRTGGGR